MTMPNKVRVIAYREQHQGWLDNTLKTSLKPGFRNFGNGALLVLDIDPAELSGRANQQVNDFPRGEAPCVSSTPAEPNPPPTT